MSKKKSIGKYAAATPREDLAVWYAKAALKQAYRSDRDKGYAERLGKASLLLAEVQLKTEELAAKASDRELERRKLEVEERRLRLLEGRGKREQKEFEAAQKKRRRGRLTAKQVDRIGETVFGLAPDRPFKPQSRPSQEQGDSPSQDEAKQTPEGTDDSKAPETAPARPATAPPGTTRPASAVRTPRPVVKRGEGVHPARGRFPSEWADSDRAAFLGQRVRWE
jgi:hypothetical protein